jgi:hypothetical protein
MASSQKAPQLGLQPPTIYDHAIQIEADIRALKEYRVNPLGKDRAPKWNAIEPLLESFQSYLRKTQGLPTSSELVAEVHATARAQEALSKDITEIKNILATPISNAATPTYAQIVKTPHILKPTPQMRPSMGHREILVKLNETDASRKTHQATAEEVKEKINSTLNNHQDPKMRSIQIMAVKRHPSGDLTLFLPDQESTEYLVTYRNTWQRTVGDKAEVKAPSFGVLIHGVSTQIGADNRVEIEEKIQWNNPQLEKAQVTYSGWLKRTIGDKRASTMVVEFDREEHADHAILNGIVFGAQIFACEYYDRGCKTRQCFKCQNYGHIGTHCKAKETCGYCAEAHSTKECTERGRVGSNPKCPNCSKNHPSWSYQCQYRKDEIARIEERRRHMPQTHREASLRWGNHTGKPSLLKDTQPTTQQNHHSHHSMEIPTLKAPSSQKRGRSPRKSLRTDPDQGRGNTTRKALQELNGNICPTQSQEPPKNKRQALEIENRPMATQDSVMTITPNEG